MLSSAASAASRSSSGVSSSRLPSPWRLRGPAGHRRDYRPFRTRWTLSENLDMAVITDLQRNKTHVVRSVEEQLAITAVAAAVVGPEFFVKGFDLVDGVGRHTRQIEPRIIEGQARSRPLARTVSHSRSFRAGSSNTRTRSDRGILGARSSSRCRRMSRLKNRTAVDGHRSTSVGTVLHTPFRFRSDRPLCRRRIRADGASKVIYIYETIG